MTANAAQRAYLAEWRVSSVDDFAPGSSHKLDYANLHDVPDPEPDQPAEPEQTEAQRLYLSTFGPNATVDDLDDFSRDIFAKMGPKAKGPDAGDTAKPATSRASGGPPQWDAQKVAGASLTPSRRLELAHLFDVLTKAHREAMAGIPEHLRETRYDVETAKHHLAPYLKT